MDLIQKIMDHGPQRQPNNHPMNSNFAQPNQNQKNIDKIVNKRCHDFGLSEISRKIIKKLRNQQSKNDILCNTQNCILKRGKKIKNGSKDKLESSIDFGQEQFWLSQTILNG